MKQDGSIESIYCHFDGYLEGVGEKLNKYYANYEIVKELIKLGDIERLGEKLNPDSSSQNDVTVAYHRDLGEKSDDSKSIVSENINEFSNLLFERWIEYIYLYDEKNSKWLCDHYIADNPKLVLRPLDEYINKYLNINENISI